MDLIANNNLIEGENLGAYEGDTWYDKIDRDDALDDMVTFTKKVVDHIISHADSYSDMDEYVRFIKRVKNEITKF